MPTHIDIILILSVSVPLCMKEAECGGAALSSCGSNAAYIQHSVRIYPILGVGMPPQNQPIPFPTSTSPFNGRNGPDLAERQPLHTAAGSCSAAMDELAVLAASVLAKENNSEKDGDLGLERRC